MIRLICTCAHTSDNKGFLNLQVMYQTILRYLCVLCLYSQI